MTEVWDRLGELIDRGGIVMIPLLAVSVISVTLILERIWFWARTNRSSKVRRLSRLNQFLATRDPRSESLISTDDSVYGVVARLITSRRPTDSVALEAVESVRPRLERFMVTLSTIITAAPLLGILGTVLGIIQSFDLLGDDSQLANPRDVSSGIAEALLTTAVGLVIALMTLFPYMIFRGQVDRTLGRLETMVAAARDGLATSIETESSETPTTSKAAARTASASV